MGNYLPSKTFVAVVLPLGTLFFVGVAFSMFYGESSGVQTPEALLANAQNELSTHLTQSDTDNDGLFDWEEALWNSDPNDSDTDKDGTGDGEEVRRSRDPTKPFPNDVITEGVPASSVTRFKADGENTETDAFAKNLLASYLELKQKQGDVDTHSQEKLVDTLIANTSVHVSVDEYSKDDLRVFENPTAEQVKAYKGAVAKALGGIANIQGHELLILKEAIVGKNTQRLGEVKKAVGVYGTITKELLAIQTPAEVATAHLTLVNDFNATGKILELGLQYESNPILALSALTQLQTVYATVGFARDDLMQFYAKYGA